jgi:hypothetical protein
MSIGSQTIMSLTPPLPDHRPVGDRHQDLVVVVDLIAASIASPISPAPAG